MSTDPFADNLLPEGDCQIPIPLNRIRGIEQEGSCLVITLGTAIERTEVLVKTSPMVLEKPATGLAVEKASGQQVYDLEEPYITLVAASRAEWKDWMVPDISRTVLREMTVTTPKPINLQELKSMETAVNVFIEQEALTVRALKLDRSKERLVFQTVPKIVVGGADADLFTIFARVKVVTMLDEETK